MTSPILNYLKRYHDGFKLKRKRKLRKVEGVAKLECK